MGEAEREGQVGRSEAKAAVWTCVVCPGLTVQVRLELISPSIPSSESAPRFCVSHDHVGRVHVVR